MAITQAICNSYKQEILSGIHLSSHTYKMALFTNSATLSKATTTYTGQSGEVSSSGTNYVTGGATLAGFSTSLDTDTAILTFTSPVTWTTATFTARGALIYNSTLSGKNAIAVIDFGSDITATNGTFTVTLPAPAASTGLIRIG